MGASGTQLLEIPLEGLDALGHAGLRVFLQIVEHGRLLEAPVIQK
jgi:hypothetical protein